VKDKVVQAMDRMVSPGAMFAAFATFMLLVAFTGGGSREDIQSLVILRPAAALFCAWALIMGRNTGFRKLFEAPLMFLIALALLMIIQLVPLPPSIWSALPGRQFYFDIAQNAGIPQPSRPLSLAPSETINALFSLLVPLAAILLFYQLDALNRNRALILVIFIALASIVWGMLQLTGTPNGPLYLYRITNADAPVGLFANRNHQAVLVTISMVALAWYAGTIRKKTALDQLKLVVAILSIPILFLMIFILGSRAGLILATISVFPIGFFLMNAGAFSGLRTKKSKGYLFGGILLVLAVFFILAIYFSRSDAFDRLTTGDNVSDLREQLLPVFVEMIKNYFPWGSGFGSFEHVYPMFETKELLRPNYLNQAHNDWVQFLIEAGLPGALLLLALTAWLMMRASRIFRWNRRQSERNTVILLFLSLAFFAVASIVDYPLRTPLNTAIAAIFFTYFASLTKRLEGSEKTVSKGTNL
jgi:O-antigen ligase